MERILELRFEVLVDSKEDNYRVLDHTYLKLFEVPEIIEVHTGEFDDLGEYSNDDFRATKRNKK